MAAPAKFLFDMDFGAPDKTRERPATPAEIVERIADAEARAYRSGYEAAQREAKAESDRRAALALEEIGIAIKGIASRFSGIEARMETEAVDVAVAVARKLCGELIAADLEAVFDVPVQVSAVLGRSKMDVGELLKLGPGTVLELDRRVGEAIDIYVNNRLVARGEVVLVEDKLGVTMTEIIKAERH
jgi:flagellar motor switch protein FliN